jgi:hypothetical protein
MAAATSRRGPPLVVLGFCSSVDAAHRIALDDERVRGACFVEGYAHPTLGFHVRRPLRALQPARWRRLLARIPLAVPGDAEMYARRYPPPWQLRREYASLVARGTRMLFIFAGDGRYNHREQLFEFGCHPRHRAEIDLEYYPRADHTFFRVEDRAKVVSRIGEWMQQRFG